MPAKLNLTSLPQKQAAFIEPMDCLAVTKLPDSTNWVWEITIDGYRAIAVKTGSIFTPALEIDKQSEKCALMAGGVSRLANK